MCIGSDAMLYNTEKIWPQVGCREMKIRWSFDERQNKILLLEANFISAGSSSVSGDELLEVQLTAKIWTLFPNSDDVEGNLH